MIFVLLALLVASTSAAGCGSLSSLLQGATFSASSGTPGFPSLSNAPWIPTTLDNKQTLTVDLGQEAKIVKVKFAGDATKSDTTSMIRFFYSNDNTNWHCISNGGSSSFCQPFYSSVPPPVKGSNVNEADLPTAVTARYFKFQPLEPSPKYRPGASSLRVDLIGCRE